MKKIDLRKAFEQKNPILNKYLPGFLFRFIERLLYIPRLNDMIEKAEGMNGLEACNSFLKYLDITYEAAGVERMPSHSKVLFISNHPLGSYDGIILIKLIVEKYGMIKTVVNDLLMHLEQLKPFFIPVDKFKMQSKQHARLMQETFMADEPMLIFPAGLASRKEKGILSDPPWRKTFLLKAIEAQRDIVPVYFEASNSNFFYKVANIRKKLGIKTNIEQFLLTHEVFNKRGAKFRVCFGEPIPYTLFDKSRSIKEWVSYVRKTVYDLPKLYMNE